METTAATNVLFIWITATNFVPILGAFLADFYVGRYPMIGFGCIISLLVIVHCQIIQNPYIKYRLRE